MTTNQNLSNNKASISLTTQVKELNAQIANLRQQLGSGKPTPIPKKPGYAHERESGLKEKYKDYHDNVIADYIYGLYHPDVVFSDCLDIKSPSYMPIPTTTFKFKETFNITPNRFGNFVLHWLPNFLGTDVEMTRIHKPNNVTQNDYSTHFANIYVNSSDAINGNSMVLNDWYAICFKDVKQDFEKYRLTSACIKLKYTGKVIDQSGMFAACASYSRTTRQLLSVPVNDSVPSSWYIPVAYTSNLASYTDFDTIRQGQWTKTCNVVHDPEGITCTYVPTDPLNQVFVNNGTTIDAVDHQHTWDGSRFLTSWYPTNANISYFLCGYGLPPSVTCITVECFYNYEIILKQEQYPYFNPRVGNPTINKAMGDINRIITDVASSGLISYTKSHEQPGVWTKVRAAFSKGAGIMRDALPYLVPLVKSLL